MEEEMVPIERMYLQLYQVIPHASPLISMFPYLHVSIP